MADMEQLYEALRKADAAGNKEDAAKLAAFIRTQPGSTSFDAVAGSAELLPQKDGTRAGPNYRPNVAPAQDSSFTASLKGDLIRDPETQKREVAETLFPNDPNGINRVGVIGGRLVKVNDAGQLEYVSNKPTEFGAGFVANLPETVAGVAGSFAASPLIGSTLGVAGARGAKDAAVGLYFNEPQTIKENLKDVGVQAGINAATAGIAKGAVGLVNRGRVVDFSPANLADAKALQATVKQKFDVDLNLAQASGDPRLIQMWRYVANYPGKSAQVADIANDLQKGQIDAAVQKFISMTGQGYPSAVLGQSAIDMSKETIKQARTKLSNEVRPLYEAAYAEVPSITNPRVVGLLRRPSMTKAVNAARTRLADEGIKYKPGQLDLRLLDKTKQELDDMISAAKMSGARSEARTLMQQKEELVKFLDNVSGNKYKAARSAYEAGMKSTVEPLESGVVGVLARITDPKAATVAAKVFSDPNVTAREILQAKGAILKTEGGAEAWDGLVRQWLARAWNGANKITQGGDTVNPAGKFAQTVAGTPTDQLKLVAALGQERGQLAVDLIDVMRKIATTSGKNSDTAFLQEITRSFRGPFARALRTLTAPRQTAMDLADQKAIEEMTVKVAEALANPAKVKQLRYVVRMPEGSRKVAMLSAVLGLNVTRAAAGDRTSADQMPVSATQQ